MTPSETPTARPQRWQFSLRTMLFVCSVAAVLCAPPVYWGWTGAALSIVLLGLVTSIWLISIRRITLVEALVIMAVTGILVAFFLPAVGSAPRRPPWRNACLNNMKQIVLAMHLYHDDHGHFPPAYIADENGQPMHSWRVLLLPYIEERKKFDAYRFDEPWNGPNNSKLAACPDIFHCPADPTLAKSALTSYVVVSGPQTAFPGEKSTSFGDFKVDGTANSILIVEVAGSGIHWMEPRDLNVQQMATVINPKNGQGISSTHSGGAVVAFADNHVEFLPDATSSAELQALLTIAGGEAVQPRD